MWGRHGSQPLVMCLLCEREDPSLDPQHSRAESGTAAQESGALVLDEKEARLTNWLIPSLVKDLLLKQTGKQANRYIK